MNRIISEDAQEIIKSDLPWELLDNKVVLITGATGYVPAYFVYAFMEKNRLYKSNIRVLALCRNEKKAKEKFRNYLGDPNFKLLIQDVCDPIVPHEKINFVIHAASPAGIFDRHKNPCDTFNANVKGCYNVLDVAHTNKLDGFLLLSSVDAYGDLASQERLKEHQSGILNPLEIRNAYSAGKRACETLCICEYMQNKIPVKIARPFQILGPGISLGDGRLHSDFMNQILNDSQIVLKGDGTAKRSFMYITDAVIGLLYVMLLGKSGEMYNVVDEQGEATVLQLAQIMAGSIQHKEVKVVFDETKRNNTEVKEALSCVVGCSDKLCKLGWTSKKSLSEAVQRLIIYYVED